MFLDDFSFDKLIHPHSSAEFFDEYFEQKPLLIKRNNPDYYQGLLSPADLDQIFFYWPNSLSTVNASVNKGSRVSMGSEARQKNLQSVLKGLDEGHSLILDSLDNRHPPLTRLCALLEIEHTWTYQTNIYVTPPASQGFKTHTDSHSVFILQTTGRKNWRVNKDIESIESRSKRGGEPEINEEDHLNFMLEQGDLVYIPKHFAHDAVSDQNSSVHITLGVHPPTWFDAVSFLLQQGSKSLSKLESSLPPRYLEQSATALGAELKKRLEELAGLDLVNIAQELLDRKKNHFRGMFFGALEQRISATPAQLDALYVKNSLLKMQLEITGEACLVQTPHKPVDLPVLFAEQVQYSLSGQAFVGSEIPGMSAEEQIVLLNRLLAEGLLVRAEQKTS